MTTPATDTLVRRAGDTRHRRASLKALGATLLVAAIAAPQGASAGSSSNKAKKQVKKPCARQVNACKSGWASACGGSDTCKQLAGCCDSLKTCDTAAQVTCMTDIL